MAAAGQTAVTLKSFPWRLSSANHSALEEEARTLYAKLIGANPTDIAITPSTSYAVSLASRAIPLRAPRHSVLVLANQMASNVMPWQRTATEAHGKLVVVPRPPDFDWATAVIERLEGPEGATIGVVALPNVRNPFCALSCSRGHTFTKNHDWFLDRCTGVMDPWWICRA